MSSKLGFAVRWPAGPEGESASGPVGSTTPAHPIPFPPRVQARQSHCPSGPSGARPSYPLRLASQPALPCPPCPVLPLSVSPPGDAHHHRSALPRYPVPCSRPCTHVPSQPCCAAPCNRRAQTQTFWDRQGPQTFHVQPTQSSIHFSTSHTFKSWTRRLPPIVPVLECLPKSVWCFALWVFSDHRPPPSCKAPEIPPSSHLLYLSPRPQSCSFCPDHPETRRLETPTHPPPSSDRHRAATHLRVCVCVCVLAVRLGTSGPISPLTHLFLTQPPLPVINQTGRPRPTSSQAPSHNFSTPLAIAACRAIHNPPPHRIGFQKHNQSPAGRSRHRKSAIKLQYLPTRQVAPHK